MATAPKLNKKILVFTVVTVSTLMAVLFIYFQVSQTDSYRSHTRFVGEITTIHGTVQIKKSGEETFIEASPKQSLFHLDRLRSDQHSKVTIEFTNGFTVELAELSDVAFQYWNPTKKDSPLYIDFSKGRFEVVKKGRPTSMFALKGTELTNLSRRSHSLSPQVEKTMDSELKKPLVETSEYADQDPAEGDNDPSLFKSLTNQQIKDYVRDNEHLLQRCQTNALRTEQELNGRVVIGFSILNKGNTEDVRVLKSTLKNLEFESCVMSVFNRFVFPPYEGQKIYISYPLSFM